MKSIYSVKFARKRKGVTDYRKRLKLLISGKPRLVIRKSLNNIIAQIVEYSPEGDKIIASANSTELKKYGWNFNRGNLPAAYLTGLLVGKKAKEAGINEAILDAGCYFPTRGSRIYSAMKGAKLYINVPSSEEVLPSEERIKGKHIKHIAEDISKEFEKVKSRIEENGKKEERTRKKG